MANPSRAPLEVIAGIFIGIALSTTLRAAWDYVAVTSSTHDVNSKKEDITDGVTGLIGDTPLVRIKSLSNALGVEILGKAEFLNPGGSVKDRVALQMIEDAEKRGVLQPHTHSRIFEGTVGSTGISIATLAAAKGYHTTIIMPDDVAEEKALALHALGADIEKVRPASIVDKKQFVNLAKSRAATFGRKNILMGVAQSTLISSDTVYEAQSLPNEHEPRGFFADQFENRSNFEAHFNGTGPEIWRQTGGRIDAFISGAGTGGTIAGTGRYLKSQRSDIRVILADPEGSGLYNKIKEGVMYDPKESEGRKRRHQVDTVVEGIGINRLTRNFELAIPIVDDAIRVTDAEAVSMSRYIVKNDGLFLGSSSACNLVAAVRVAKTLGRESGCRIVTILCDSGSRHYSKFWNDPYLAKIGISANTSIIEKLLLEQ
ncbi:putative cysteine synthase [Serendipita vermifera]|nr:putative cysteine synthase [Serendipita vermifera]